MNTSHHTDELDAMQYLLKLKLLEHRKKKLRGNYPLDVHSTVRRKRKNLL